MITFQNPSADPFYNQAFEEVVFETVRDDDVFFLWRNSPAVIVGCYQNICREVKVELLRKQQIPVIRRMTGGGTVYHDLGNVNYTLILQNTSIVDYDDCLRPVIAGLNAIGIPARKNRTCDIAIGNSKISGSAQRVSGGRLLHHGTLLFDADLNVLDQVTTHYKNDHFQTKGTLSAICPVTNIRSHMKEEMSIETFMEHLTEQIVPAGHQVRELTEEQKKRILRLRDEKYRSWEWTWGKTPSFTYEKNGYLGDDPIFISYCAHRGILSEVRIRCSSVDGELASNLLNGARLDPEGLAAACSRLAGDRKCDLLDLLI